MSETVHATLAATWRDGGWTGVLLRGPSGAGKSTLALRLIQRGWRLVADDRVTLWASGGQVFGRAPATLRGLIEARGVGVVPASALPWARVRLVVDLTAPESVERMPEARRTEVAGVALPVIDCWAHDTAAEAKLAYALNSLLACDATSPLTRAPTGVSSWRAAGPEPAAARRGPLMRNR
jgi:serine kinase of HPr protein (carbohydrate metabolism regulator)